MQRFNELQKEVGIIKEVRVCGVMVGVELSIDGGGIVSECMKRGLLINCTQGSVIRLLPAMNLPEELAQSGFDILADVLRQANQSGDE